MKIRNNKGITLIALVITIIVLLILAGVTISMVLGDDGIIAQAQSAKKAQEDASEQEAMEIARGEAKIAKYVKQTPMEEDEINQIFNFPAENPYKKNVARVVEGVPIPIGFAYVEGTKKETGLIIVDGEGNEFVWVPVDEVLENGSANYTDNKVSLINNGNDKIIKSKIDGDEITNYLYEITKNIPNEYDNMKNSVSIYKGFYVGRYETSWTGSRVASVPNVTPMLSWDDLGSNWTDIDTASTNSNEATWYGLYVKQKELYENSNSVVSGMIYGSQWDAIVDWMSKVPNPDGVKSKLYITDSTNMGWYSYNIADNPAHITGLDLNGGKNKVKNIYDLAGNYFEMTQEAGGDNMEFRAYRGGSFMTNVTSTWPMSDNEFNWPPEDADLYSSSRLQLYIK